MTADRARAYYAGATPGTFSFGVLVCILLRAAPTVPFRCCWIFGVQLPIALVCFHRPSVLRTSLPESLGSWSLPPYGDVSEALNWDIYKRALRWCLSEGLRCQLALDPANRAPCC